MLLLNACCARPFLRTPSVLIACSIAHRRLSPCFIVSAFKDYFATMPFLALPFSDRKTAASLTERFSVQGYPTLVFIDEVTASTRPLPMHCPGTDG
jgi:hypothetical protein